MKQALIILVAMLLVLLFSGMTFAISGFTFEVTPASEPVVLLLLGTGLIGASSISRNMLLK